MTLLKTFAALAALSAIAQATPAAAADNLVTNGGFETGSFSGWTVTGDHASVIGSNGSYSPNSGSFFANLGDVSETGSLSQTIGTVAGETYTLSYSLASHGDYETFFSVDWNGQTIAGSQLTDPNSNSIYQLFSFLVTGTGSDTLTIHAWDHPSYIALDDVSLVANVNGAVPEPATWAMMLIGFGGIGFAMRRKRGAAVTPQIA
jgi:hypothetical protein